MCTTEEKLYSDLSHVEYRLLDVLCSLSQLSVVKVSKEDLAKYCKVSLETIRRSLRGLEEKNLITTVRTKRNLGKYSYNVYQMISPSHTRVEVESEPSHTSVQSTAVPVSSTVDMLSVPDTTNKLEKTTSSLVRSGVRTKKILKKAVVIMNKWTDDDDIVGVGLFDNEVPASKKLPKASKRNPKTRNQRPHEDWTAWDVATEFSSRVYQVLPGLPFPVDTRKVWGGITNARKSSDSNPIIELEIMKMFFEDPWLVREGMDKPAAIAPRFLKMLSTHFNRALKNLKLPELDSQRLVPQNVTERASHVYASDGTQFDNSMFGRKMLREYEEALNGVSSHQS